MPIPQKGRKVAMSSAEKSSPPASAIIANTSRGYHILMIDGYSNTKGIPTGEALQSCHFNMCGYRWLIGYYPNGDHSDCADYISLFLVLDETDIEEVKARLKFRFVSDTQEFHLKSSSSIRRVKHSFSFLYTPLGFFSNLIKIVSNV
jgi:hypothetical protein